MSNLFNGVYNNKTILVTGHTGFKGSWLALWLSLMGAKVVGYSLEPDTNPNHFGLLDIECTSIIGDIRDNGHLYRVFKKYNPDIIFHLAAQSIVRRSYNSPIDTYETNLLGTLNIYEAARACNNVKAIVSVTTDKVYKNREADYAYNEDDTLGGHDVYSSSKACVELMTDSYKKSFLHNTEKNALLVATARAGNVIGGGDWAEDRLIPDIVKAVHEGWETLVRNPNSIRPWQHVLEPLSGYLLLGQKLLEQKREYADSWNFGPNPDEEKINVENIVKFFQSSWSKVNYKIEKEENGGLHEAKKLQLNSQKARKQLKWHPVWDNNHKLQKTIDWYKNFYENNRINSQNDIFEYIRTATKQNLVWVAYT